MFAAYGLRQDIFMAHAVLQRHDHGLRADDGPCRSDRFGGMEGFNEHDHQVGRRKAGATGGGFHPDAMFRVAVPHDQAIVVDGIDMRLESIDQRDIRAGLGQCSADRATECAGSEDINLHLVSLRRVEGMRPWVNDMDRERIGKYNGDNSVHCKTQYE